MDETYNELTVNRFPSDISKLIKINYQANPFMNSPLTKVKLLFFNLKLGSFFERNRSETIKRPLCSEDRR